MHYIGIPTCLASRAWHAVSHLNNIEPEEKKMQTKLCRRCPVKRPARARRLRSNIVKWRDVASYGPGRGGTRRQDMILPLWFMCFFLFFLLGPAHAQSLFLFLFIFLIQFKTNTYILVLKKAPPLRRRGVFTPALRDMQIAYDYKRTGHFCVFLRFFFRAHKAPAFPDVYHWTCLVVIHHTIILGTRFCELIFFCFLCK